jgi:hypothetical protein
MNSHLILLSMGFSIINLFSKSLSSNQIWLVMMPMLSCFKHPFSMVPSYSVCYNLESKYSGNSGKSLSMKMGRRSLMALLWWSRSYPDKYLRMVSIDL